MGQDLHVDAGLIHLAQPQLAEIIETPEHLGVAHAFAADELRGKLLVPVVLLERDHRTFRPVQHAAPPMDGHAFLGRARPKGKPRETVNAAGKNARIELRCQHRPGTKAPSRR
jgi:hypothetical protein